MGAEIVKLLWKWDAERTINLVKTYVQPGIHPSGWKTANGLLIPEPGNRNTVRCEHSESSPCWIHWENWWRRRQSI